MGPFSSSNVTFGTPPPPRVEGRGDRVQPPSGSRRPFRFWARRTTGAGGLGFAPRGAGSKAEVDLAFHRWAGRPASSAVTENS